MRAAVAVLACGLAAGVGAPAMAALPENVTTADVCAVVPGAEVARTLGGSLDEAALVRPDGANARCRYTVTTRRDGKPVRAVLILWLHAAADFADLRKYQEDPVKPVEGLGDAAFIAFHPDSGRHDAFALVRGVAVVEVTGPDPAGVRAVAAVAVGLLRAASRGR